MQNTKNTEAMTLIANLLPQLSSLELKAIYKAAFELNHKLEKQAEENFRKLIV